MRQRVIVADSVSEVIPLIDNRVNLVNADNKSSIENDEYFFKSVTVDPDNLCSETEKLFFTNINQRYNNVFDPTFGAYNDHTPSTKRWTTIVQPKEPAFIAR